MNDTQTPRRRRALSALGVLAIAATGAVWAGCGDDEDEARDAAEQLQEDANEAIDQAQEELEDADVNEAIEEAQEEANQAQQDLQDAVEDGDIDAAIEEAQSRPSRRSRTPSSSPTSSRTRSTRRSRTPRTRSYGAAGRELDLAPVAAGVAEARRAPRSGPARGRGPARRPRATR